MRTVRLLLLFVLMGTVPLLASGSTVQVNLVGLTYQTASGPDMGSNTTHINVGDTVMWVWMGSNHSVTSDTLVSGTPLFDSAVQVQPFTFSYTFTAAGSYPYHCTIHGMCCNMKGTVIVNAVTATVSGTIGLTGSTNLAQTLTFQFRPTVGSSFTNMVTLTADGAYSLSGIPAGTYNIAIKGPKWLQKVVQNIVVATNVMNVNATLLPGDLDGNNVVDLRDSNILATAFGSVPTSVNWNANADLDCNNVVDLRDFNLLAANFGKTGDP